MVDLCTRMDRLAPGCRPRQSLVGYLDWRDLLFLHWAVPPEAVRPQVPAELELDLHHGMAYVGIVAFGLERLRARLVPPFLGMSFREVNLRTYVHHEGKEPGVYFLSMDADSSAAVAGARLLTGLPYYPATIRATMEEDARRYTMQRLLAHASLDVRYRPGDRLGPSRPDTIEHFLLERYSLYVQHAGMLLRMRVHHPPYDVQRADVISVSETLSAAHALPPLGAAPLAHFAPAVDVEAFRLERP